jgi:hexosaminidase
MGNGMSGPIYKSDDKHPTSKNFTLTWYTLYAKDGEKSCVQVLDLTNRGHIVLESQGWTLYFNLLHRIKTSSINPSLQIERINGHFYKITPTDKFKSLNHGDTLKITFETQIPIFKESAIPKGFYIIFEEDGGKESLPQTIFPVQIGSEITSNQTIRSPNDNTPVTTPQSRYKENKNLTILPSNKVSKIVPTPIHIIAGESEWQLNTEVVIEYQKEVEKEATFLDHQLKKLLGKSLFNVPQIKDGKRKIVLNIADIEVDGIKKKSGNEAYQLVIDRQMGVMITGTDKRGVFYGIQSLLALLPIEILGKISDKIMLDEVIVEDAPRFSYRGLQLDVARNFQSVQTVLKFIDWMAFYKLNKFHFHLTDDEGWRLEIKSLPELTEVGGRRGHTIDESDRLIPSFGSGPNVEGVSEYYSEEEFMEILKYANERHIEVIPELDVPGHARAAIKAMETRYHRLITEGKPEEASAYRLIDPNDKSVYKSVQNFNDNVIDVCLPSTYRFLEKVIDEIIDMYRLAQVPLSMIHIGGDEVPGGIWQKSPACEQLITDDNQLKNVQNLPDYFLKKVHKILDERGLIVAGWEEIALIENPPGQTQRKIPNKKFLDHNFIPYVWNNVWSWGAEDLGYQLANAGYQIVMCNATNLYFDCAYNKDPKEPGLYWPGFVNTRDAFEFVPFDIYKSATVDRLGNPINLDLYKNHTRLSEQGISNILGIQGQLWGEEMEDSLRLEYMAFPKVLGLAERAWAKQPEWATMDDKILREEKLNKDWNTFVNSIGQREMVRLDNFDNGVSYRIPPPGAIIEGGQLKANIAYPGFEIRYTIDGTEPTKESNLYKSPVSVMGTVKLKAFSQNGRSSRLVTVYE